MARTRDSLVHPARVRWVRQGPPASGSRYVLYWIQINQRARMNAALDFAVEEADRLDLPVLAYQGLRPDYPGANDRIHAFILDGAFDLASGLASKRIRHFFHLERRRSAASGLIAALAREAAVVVTDHFPVFIVNAQTRALAGQIERPLAAIDASCIVPLALFPRAEPAARTFRPRIHRVLPEALIPREEIAPRRSSLDLEIPFPFPGSGLEAEERDWLDLGARPPAGPCRRKSESAGDSAWLGAGPAGPTNAAAGARARAAGRSRASTRKNEQSEARGGAPQPEGWSDGGDRSTAPADGGREDARRRGLVSEWVASCAIDHTIAPSPIFRGGEIEARRRLARFVEGKLGSYAEARDDPSVDGTSGLSAYLHFGHISALEVALEVLSASSGRPPSGAEREGDHRSADGVHRSAADTRPPAGGDNAPTLTPQRPADSALFSSKMVRRSAGNPEPPSVPEAAGDEAKTNALAPDEIREALAAALSDREGAAGAFLEQLVVRRELAFNFCERTPDHGSIDALPSWARRTLSDHEDDDRPRAYEAGALEWSETEDEVWNAAQRELRLTGVIHNRMRMLWGKKILEWSPSPAEALRRMIDLHERYALDGRDPNTYANVLWCLGLHDRPFGPARAVLGTVRSMSAEILRRRFDFESYAARMKRLEESS